MLIRIIKDWDYPNILRQTPNYSGVWDGLTFTTKEVEKCDMVVVLNKIPEDTEVKCNPNNIIAIMQEPYISDSHSWMVEGHDQFSKVYTHHIFKEKEKYVRSFPMLPWHVDKSYDELKNINLENISKNKSISWITSNKNFFPGHRDRMFFLKELKKSNLEIDLFGRGINEINDKWDGLSSYKYSLAIENSSTNDYWTEKLADCYLSYTMPIYYGCTNIDDYFPKDSMIKIDINKPCEAFEIIQRSIKDRIWEENIEAITEARSLVLEKYNIFNQISGIYNNNDWNKEDILLKKYEKSLKLKVKKKIERTLNKVLK